jgi:hypothetical protein
LRLGREFAIGPPNCGAYCQSVIRFVDADGEHQFLDVVIHWKASDARGNINPNGRRRRLFLTTDSRAADVVAELETGAPLPLEVADFDGREGPLTPVNALESVLSFVIVKSCSK